MLLLPKLVDPHRKMWRAVQAVHPLLQVTQKEGEQVMLKVAEMQAKVWSRPLAKAELPDFAKRMALRYRTQAKHICATCGKHPKTAWLAKLFAPPTAETLGTHDTDAADAAAEATDDDHDDGPDDENNEEGEGEEEEAVQEDSEADADNGEHAYDDEEGESTDHDKGQNDTVPTSTLPPQSKTQRPPAKISRREFLKPGTEMPLFGQRAEHSSQPSSSAAGDSRAGDEHVYGYDPELKRFWRQRIASGPKGFKDCPCKIDESGTYPVVFFQDNPTAGVVIKAITCAELEIGRKLDKAGPGVANIWSATGVDGVKLRLGRSIEIGFGPRIVAEGFVSLQIN